MSGDISACGVYNLCKAQRNCKRAMVAKIQMNFPQSWINGEHEKGSGCQLYLPKEQQQIKFTDNENNDLLGIF